MVNLYIIGTKDFIASIKEQIQQTAVQVDIAGATSDPAAGSEEVDKYIEHIDAVLVGLPQEQVETIIDIITRDEISAAVFVSVENITTEYKKWAKYKAKSVPKGMEIQTVVNYFANKLEHSERDIGEVRRDTQEREERKKLIESREAGEEKEVDHEGLGISLSWGKGLKNVFSTFKKGFGKDKEKGAGVIYVSHPLVAVWNPTGNNKTQVSLGLAAEAGREGFNTVLMEMDLAAPLLDFYFKIPQTGVEECKTEVKGPGIMTLGENIKPEYVTKLLVKKKRFYYLPAGNKLNNLGTPDYTVEQIEKIIYEVYHRSTNKKPAATIINTGNYYELPFTIGALHLSTIMVVPIETNYEAELVEHQLEELKRLEVLPETIEVVYSKKIKRVCDKRVYLSKSSSFDPDDNKEYYNELLNQII